MAALLEMLKNFSIDPWVYRGLQMIAIGLTIHLLSSQYARFLTENKCPFCKADVPDGADLCPACYRNLTGYTGIDLGAIFRVAFTLMLVILVVFFVLVPYPSFTI